MAYYEGEINPMGYGNNNGWGNEAWWIVILLALGWGNNGFGNGLGGRGGSSELIGYELGKVATTNDVASGFSTSTIMSNQRESQLAMQQGFSDVQQTLCRGFSDINLINERGFATTNYNMATNFGALGSKIDSCCCGIQRAIDGINYNMATNTCQILQGQTAQTQRIIDYLTCKENQNLRDENFALRLQASQAKQNAYLLNEIKPCPIPAYNVPNPNCCYTGCNGTGFGFNGFSVQ